LILAGALLGFYDDKAKVLDIAIQAGAIFAVILVYWPVVLLGLSRNAARLFFFLLPGDFCADWRRRLQPGQGARAAVNGRAERDHPARNKGTSSDAASELDSSKPLMRQGCQRVGPAIEASGRHNCKGGLSPHV
jgi:hypothetical protein